MRNIAIRVADELDLTESDKLKTQFRVFDDLSDLQNAYIYWRSLGFSPYQSAKKAGYSSHWSKQGLANEAHPRIREEIDRAHNEARTKYEIDRNKVLEGLLEALAVAREQSDPKEMREAWMAIAEMSGNAVPQVHEVKVSGGVTVSQITDKSERELLEILGRERRIPTIIEDAEYAEIPRQQPQEEADRG